MSCALQHSNIEKKFQAWVPLIKVFLAELKKISCTEAEGEAGVYFTAAMTLKDTILQLRNNIGLKDYDLCLGLDLVRVESLQSLDQERRRCYKEVCVDAKQKNIA